MIITKYDVQPLDTEESAFPVLYLQNIFSERDMNEMLFEADWIRQGNKLRDPNHTGAARRPDGSSKKQNNGIYLNGFYGVPERPNSAILKNTQTALEKIKHSKEVSENWFLLNLLRFNFYSSELLSYYESSDHYESHNDLSIYTFLFWMYKEPKGFSGGQLKFTDYDVTFEADKNCGLLFPGSVNHEVLPITNNNVGEGFGRYSIASLLVDSIPPDMDK